jgi:N-carbamoylputrescine amidase
MAESRTLRIALVQQRAGDDLETNAKRAEEAIIAATARGAQLVCLQELFRSHYFPQEEHFSRFDLAESIPGPTSERMGKLAAELHVVLVVPIFERRAAGVFHNSAVVFDSDGSTAGVYRKMHIPDDPLFLEKFYFSPGDLGFHAFDTSVGRIGVLICWDQWFPEAARLLTLDGAELILYPTAIAWVDADSADENEASRDSWITVQRGHAIANGVFVAAVNRIGTEGQLRFYGSSFVSDPQGQLLAQASIDSEEILVADCDLDSIDRQRRVWPFLRDRRIDAYAELLERYRR